LKGKGIGVATLRRHYSSKKRNGVLKNHTKIATGKIIRYCLKELQRLGLIETIEIKVEDDAGKVENLCSAGRRCTKRGKMDLDRIAANIYHAKNQ
jgi:ribosomal protein S19E (S16A)